MPDYDAVITGFATGDDLEVRRTVDRSLSNIPDGVTITKAWLTIKTLPEDLDASAVAQKEVTTSDNPGVGQVENNGSGDVDPILRFDLTPDDTRGIGVRHRDYDIQVLTSNSKIYTGEKGHIYAEVEITIDDV